MIPKFLAIHQEKLQASRFWYDKCLGPYFSFAFVFLKHKSSFVLNITTGMPQGSELGFLFLILNNDLPLHKTSERKMANFSDKTFLMKAYKRNQLIFKLWSSS